MFPRVSDTPEVPDLPSPTHRHTVAEKEKSVIDIKTPGNQNNKGNLIAEQQRKIATFHLALGLASKKDVDELQGRVNYQEQQQRQLKLQKSPKHSRKLHLLPE